MEIINIYIWGTSENSAKKTTQPKFGDKPFMAAFGRTKFTFKSKISNNLKDIISKSALGELDVFLKQQR